MSRRKERLVITCDGCDKEIDHPHAHYVYEILPASISGNAETRAIDLCRHCHNRVIPAFNSLREPLLVKPSWWSRIFGGAR